MELSDGLTRSSLGPGVATSANRHGGVVRDRGCTDELAWRRWQPDRRGGRRPWGSSLQLRASWIGPYCSILGWQRPQPTGLAAAVAYSFRRRSGADHGPPVRYGTSGLPVATQPAPPPR